MNMLTHPYDANDRYHRAEVRKTDRRQSGGVQRSGGALASALRLWRADGSHRHEASERLHAKLRLQPSGSWRAAMEAWLLQLCGAHGRDAPLSNLGADEGSLPQRKQQSVLPIRRARYFDLRRLAGRLHGLSGLGAGVGIFSKSHDRSHRQRRELLPRELSLGDDRAAGRKSLAANLGWVDSRIGSLS